MTDYFSDKTVLITGASSGIGLEMARQLAPRGARLLLVARREDVLHAVANELDTESRVFSADLQRHDTPLALATAIEASGETVDIVINNAGFGLSGPFREHASSARGMADLNVAALTELTACFLPQMVDRGRGGILNVASVGAFMPVPRMAVYAATKAYVLSFSDALHHEMRGSGVQVSCLCPGPVRTEFAERAGMRDAFFESALPVEQVARAGLQGLARGKRRVVPGVLSKLQAFAPRFSPVGVGLTLTERVSRRAD